MTSIKFKQGVVCDDIRVENNGKYIIIGIYSSAFVPSRLPLATQIKFGVWAQIEGPGHFECEFEVILEPDGSPVAGIEMQFDTLDDETEVFLPLPTFPVNIGSPGHIVLRERRSGQEVIRLKISAPSSAAEPPPSRSQSDAPAS